MLVDVKVIAPGTIMLIPGLVSTLGRGGTELPEDVCFEVSSCTLKVSGDGFGAPEVESVYTLLPLDQQAVVCGDPIEVNMDLYDYSEV